MGYIEQNLMAGERVMYRANKHWAIFILPAILLLIPPLGIILLILTYFNYKTSEFAVTNKRVLIKVGIIRRETLETLLTKIEGIQVDQSILGRMFDYGTIIVRGTGGTSNPFKTIMAPFEFRKKVQEQVEAMHTVSTVQATTPSQGKFCTKCGAKNAYDAKFCAACGMQTA